jgi:hypothetical protein
MKYRKISKMPEDKISFLRMKFLNVMAAIFLLVVFVQNICTQTISTITYESGSSVNIESGADECADNIIVNGTFSGGGTICSGALPVTLISFTNSVNKNDVKLVWVTDNEINNAGFDVERAAISPGVSMLWNKIGFVEGKGNTAWQSIYTYEDIKMRSGSYRYRIKQIDYNGNYEYFELANDVEIAKPGKFFIGQNYPNPSNPRSKIDFELPVDGRVSIRLYNLLGEEVSTVLDETREAGYYSAEFDGSMLASGVYFYRIYAEGKSERFTKTMKMVLVK